MPFASMQPFSPYTLNIVGASNNTEDVIMAVHPPVYDAITAALSSFGPKNTSLVTIAFRSTRLRPVALVSQ
jgi:hypothetical protein